MCIHLDTVNKWHPGTAGRLTVTQLCGYMKACPVPFTSLTSSGDTESDTDDKVQDDTAAFQDAANALAKDGKPISLGSLFGKMGKT